MHLALDKSHLGEQKFDVLRSKVKVTGNEDVKNHFLLSSWKYRFMPTEDHHTAGVCAVFFRERPKLYKWHYWTVSNSGISVDKKHVEQVALSKKVKVLINTTIQQSQTNFFRLLQNFNNY